MDGSLKTEKIEKAAQWVADQPDDLPNKMGLIQNIFGLTPGQAAQALTLGRQFRTNRRAFG
jgi:hypothetical protein